MKKIILAVLLLGALIAPRAYAQVTAAPVQTGYLSTSGCSYGLTVCFVQYGATGPSGGTVVTTPTGVTSTDAGALTVTTGGTYQTVFSASATRKSCLIQNPPTAALQGIGAAEILSVKLGAQASIFTIPVGGTFSCANPDGTVVQDAILMTGATIAHAFAAVTQ